MISSVRRSYKEDFLVTAVRWWVEQLPEDQQGKVDLEQDFSDLLISIVEKTERNLGELNDVERFIYYFSAYIKSEKIKKSLIELGVGNDGPLEVLKDLCERAGVYYDLRFPPQSRMWLSPREKIIKVKMKDCGAETIYNV